MCAKNGIVINEAKFQFCKQTVDFAGLSVTDQGVQPSKKITDAIRNFPPPTDITKARSFFGLVNQVNWAYANCSEMAPFRSLVKPNACFTWTDDLKLLFEKCKLKILNQVKEGITKYDVNRVTCLQTDFSKQGLGYLLLQKYCNCDLEAAPLCCKDGWRLVYAGSRFTKGAEETYAPTEGELLAVSWALEHSSIFTKGCPNLIISTDHKPLLGILNERPFEKMKNPRHIRLKERTLPFHFIVKFNRGKWHRGPDALSRNPHCAFFDIVQPFWTSHGNADLPEEVEGILALAELSENSSVSYRDIQHSTSCDPVLNCLITTINNGFPNTEHLTDPRIRNFFNGREHLWVQNGLVMFKNRIVVPSQLRKRILELLHAAHQGVDGMTSRATNTVYWPGINAAIRRVRDNCTICNRIQPSQPREPIQMLPAPDYPFQHICLDAFELVGQHYIAAVDKFSNWLMIFHIRVSPKSKHVVECLRSIFTSYGTAEKIFTDGGLPFQASDVKEFLNTWKVSHITSSASYPQSNGRAELAVKTAKRILQENTGPGGSLNCDKASRALLQFRNTPIKHIGLSPAQIVFHRNIRDGVPVNPASLRPNKLWIIAAKKREEQFVTRNKSLISRYNQTTRELPFLDVGTSVYIQDTDRGHRWSRFGIIVQRDGRRYMIKVSGSGQTITRNRRFIKPVLYHEDNVQSPGSLSVTGDNSNSSADHTTTQAENVSSTTSQSIQADSQNDTTDTSHIPSAAKRIKDFNKPGLQEDTAPPVSRLRPRKVQHYSQ